MRCKIQSTDIHANDYRYRGAHSPLPSPPFLPSWIDFAPQGSRVKGKENEREARKYERILTGDTFLFSLLLFSLFFFPLLQMFCAKRKNCIANATRFAIRSGRQTTARYSALRRGRLATKDENNRHRLVMFSPVDWCIPTGLYTHVIVEYVHIYIVSFRGCCC